MKKRIKRISIHRSALTISLANGLIMAFALLVSSLANIFIPESETPEVGLVGLLAPLQIALITYVMIAFLAIAYNITSKYVGGIEVEISEQ